MVQVSTENTKKVDISPKHGFVDIASYLGIIGGTAISLITQQAAFATIPFSVALSLQIWTRKQLSAALLSNSNEVTEVCQNLNLHDQKIMKLDEQSETLNETIAQLSQEHRKTSLGVISLQGHCQENDSAVKELAEKIEEINTLLQALKEITSSSGKIGASMSAAEAYYERGCQQEDLEHYEAAIADYSEAILKSPNFAEAYFKRGLVRAKLDLKQSAVADLNTAAKYFFEQGNLERYQEAKQASSNIHSATVNAPDNSTADKANEEITAEEAELISVGSMFS